MRQHFFFLLLLPFLSIAGPNSTALEKGEIHTWLEEVPESKLKRAITETVIDAPLDKVWSVAIDYGHYAEFMPKIKESRILKTDGNSLRYYSYVNMPFPISDVSYEAVATSTTDRKSVKVEMVPGTGRGLKQFRGEWKLSPYNGNEKRTLTNYSVIFESVAKYPDWAVNFGLKHTVGKILQAVRDRLKSGSH